MSDVIETLRPFSDQLLLKQWVEMFGVKYLHLLLQDGSDLYITEYGLPFAGHLLPQNYWTDVAWFNRHSLRLPGSSTLYRIETKAVDGQSKQIVLKWNRMGQDVPGETEADDLLGAEFNSPFEEFSLLMELRDVRGEGPGRLATHRPLAIYVPREFVEMDRLGRKSYRIEAMQKSHGEIKLHPNRQYAVLYGWVKGIDAMAALQQGMISANAVRALWSRSDRKMEQRGFRVLDSKARHIIVRPTRTGTLATDRQGDPLYALIDFELLERTPQHEQAVREVKRKSYLLRQAHRFEAAGQYPDGLAPVNIMGVDYVFGHVESTGGTLWVVGRDPSLFEYFLPEKWRKTARNRLSDSNRVYDTVTKDNIHLVWRVSRVGTRPDIDAASGTGARAIRHGYNSPFEEVSLSMRLARSGLDTTYPRAIYMTGHKSEAASPHEDETRYRSHAALSTPDGHTLLSENHDYMTVWGYWNGPDEWLAANDREYYRSIDAQQALEQGVITERTRAATIEAAQRAMSDAGFEDLGCNGSHLLLSLQRTGALVLNRDGLPVTRLCNFALMKRMDTE